MIVDTRKGGIFFHDLKQNNLLVFDTANIAPETEVNGLTQPSIELDPEINLVVGAVMGNVPKLFSHFEIAQLTSSSESFGFTGDATEFRDQIAAAMFLECNDPNAAIAIAHLSSRSMVTTEKHLKTFGILSTTIPALVLRSQDLLELPSRRGTIPALKSNSFEL
jgi:hypothetical protein